MRNINWERRDKIGKVQANRKLKIKKKEMGSWKNSKKSKMLIKKRKGWDKKKGKKEKRKKKCGHWCDLTVA